MEFEYGLTKERKCRQKVPIKRIFLEKCWKFEIGQYRSYKQLPVSGKDIAILLLQRQIKENQGYPELLPFKQEMRLKIQVYGYPSACIEDHKDASMLRTNAGPAILANAPYKDGWGRFTHQAHLFQGMYKPFFFGCICVCFQTHDI